MRCNRYQTPGTAILLAMLLCSSIARSQAPRSSTVRADPPKAEGAIRIGLVTPRVSLIGGGGTVAQETTLLRQNVSSYLTGPRIGTIALQARLDSLALEEGKERGCDYVLYTSMIRKRQLTNPGSAGAGGTKAGDEFTFEYKLVSTEGLQAVVANVARAKVQSDGEDVVTPMIEGAAQAVVTVARAKIPAPFAIAGPTPNVENVDPAERPRPATTSSMTGYGSLSASPPSTRTAPSVSDPPKAEDAIRIGIATPRVNFIGGSATGNREATSMRETVTAYLSGTTIETIDLKARLDSLVVDEGKRRQCDYVLYTSLIWKRQLSNSRTGSPLGGVMGSLGGPGVGSKMPGGKTAQEISKGAASVTGSIAALTRAKDEITFEYRLVATDGARPGVANVSKAKVKSDGEDVLTPMIEAAAQAIVDVTKKSKPMEQR